MTSPDQPGHRYHGVYPVFQTPLRDDESVDAELLSKEINWLFDQGSAGIVMAMVSEVLRFSSEERDELAALACEAAAGRGPVIISVGAESTAVACRHAVRAEALGADALMAIPPVSTAVDETELHGYFCAILDSVSIPVVVQDASGYVGRPMSLNLQAELHQHYGARVMFKPEATPIGPRLSELRDLTAASATIFEGTGGIALVDSYRRGTRASMPGADVVWAVVALFEALERNDQAKIDAINGPLTCLIALQTSLDSFLAIEKYLLVQQGIFTSTRVRGPVGFRLDDETRREVDRLVALLADAVND